MWDFSKTVNDFEYDLVPDGTLAKVRVTIQPGFYNDETRDLTDEWATKSDATGAIYIKTENTLLSTKHKGSKVLHLIGIHSNKGPTWKEMGQVLIKKAIDSARGIQPKDRGLEASKKRQFDSFNDLMEFLDDAEIIVEIGVEPDNKGRDRNVIKTVITPEHPRYLELMGKPEEAVKLDDEIPF